MQLSLLMKECVDKIRAEPKYSNAAIVSEQTPRPELEEFWIEFRAQATPKYNPLAPIICVCIINVVSGNYTIEVRS